MEYHRRAARLGGSWQKPPEPVTLCTSFGGAPCRAEAAMPRGDKSAYTDKQKRKAEHIEENYESRGVDSEEAERRAWATVNKESGGGNKSGSGRGKKTRHASPRRGGKRSHARSR